MPTPKSSKAPAFQFYPKDFLSSSKVQRMTLTEIGVYTLLLSHCWLDNGLPGKVDQIAKLVKIPAPRFRAMWAGPLSECFTERGGKFHNARLDEERKKQAEHRRRNSDNAHARWDKRRNAVALKPHSETHALQSPISDLQLSTKKEREIGEPFFAPDESPDGPDGQAMFLQLMDEYPSARVTDDDATRRQFVHELGPDPGEYVARFTLMLATLALHKSSDQWKTPRFIPNMVNWLKRGDWRGTRKLELASTGTEGRGRTGAPPKGKYAGIEEQD